MAFILFDAAELLGHHEGKFARYPIRPGEFAAWQEI
jgi:hypothetical protein